MVARAAGVRGAVPPREVGPRRAARCCATSCACAPHDPPAGRGHPRRPGGAPAAGRLRRARPSTARTRSRPRATSWRPARALCTWSTSTARARASRPTSTTSSASRASSTLPVQYGGGLRSLALDTARARGRRGASDARHGGAHRRGASSTQALADFRDAHRGGRGRARRAGSRSPGWTGRRRRRGEEVIREHAAAAGSRASSTRTSSATGCSRGRISRRSARVLGRGARSLYSGGIGSLDDLRGPARAAAAQPGRRDLRQGAVRAAVHACARPRRCSRP